MTIQISVVVWTVICFLILYFILKKLLFEPVLDVMDKREKKIADAEKAAADARAKVEKQREERILGRKEAEKERAALREKEQEAFLSKAKTRLENAKAESMESVENHRIRTEAEFEAEVREADVFTDKAAKLFLSRLFERQ